MFTFAAIAAKIEDALDHLVAEPTNEPDMSPVEVLAEWMKVFAEPECKYDGRDLAHVGLNLINRGKLNEAEIARLCNVTRQCVSKDKVKLADRLNLTKLSHYKLIERALLPARCGREPVPAIEPVNEAVKLANLLESWGG